MGTLPHLSSLPPTLQPDTPPYVRTLASAAVWLLQQRAAGNSSLWAPFVRALPPHVASPVVMPAHVVRQFQAEAVTAAVRGGEEGRGCIGC